MLGLLSIEFDSQLLNSLLEVELFLFKAIVLGLQCLDIGVGGRSQVLFNELDCVAGLFWLFVESHKHLRQLVDHARALQVLSEFLLLLFSCLNTHTLNYN